MLVYITATASNTRKEKSEEGRVNITEQEAGSDANGPMVVDIQGNIGRILLRNRDADHVSMATGMDSSRNEDVGETSWVKDDTLLHTSAENNQ